MSRARDLSKLANPGVFSVDTDYNVGVDSTTPDAKFDVTGIVSATQYYGDGSNLTGIVAGATLSPSNGTQRVVVTSQTSGSMTAAGTNSDLTYDTGSNTLSATQFSGTFLGNSTGLQGTPNLNVGVVTSTEFNGRLGDYSETVNNIGNTGANCNINVANGTHVIATLNQSTTFTFTSPSSGSLFGFTLQLTNGTGGPFSITWPASIKWTNNVIPVRTTTDGRTDVWSFFTSDGGTNWYGSISLFNFIG